jgi:hypothetical protein
VAKSLPAKQALNPDKVNNRLFVGILQRDVVLLRKMQKSSCSLSHNLTLLMRHIVLSSASIISSKGSTIYL